MDLIFRQFRHEDFQEYLSWFGNSELNNALGPMNKNDDWLESVLSQTDGIEYSIFRNKELLSVIGIKFPEARHSFYCITDFAVNPKFVRRGMGSEILARLIALHSDDSCNRWTTYINANNQAAQLFFRKNSWVCESEKPDSNDMLEFTYYAQSA